MVVVDVVAVVVDVVVVLDVVVVVDFACKLSVENELIFVDSV